VRSKPILRADLARRAGWSVLLVAALFLLFGGGYLSLPSMVAKLTFQVIAVTILGGWLAIALMRPSWRPATPLVLPVLIASGAYSLSFLLSQRPRLSLEPTLGGLAFGLAFLFLTRLLADPWYRRRAGMLLQLVVAFVAVGYVVEVFASWINWWGLVGRLAIPPLRPEWAGFLYGQPNTVGVFLILGGPLAVVVASQSPGQRRLAWLLAASITLAVFLTGSRAAYLGAGIGSLVIFVLLVSRTRLREIAGGFLVRAARNRAKASIAVLPTLIALVLLPAIALRFARGGVGIRLDLWSSALSIFTDHPLTGGGPGTWVQLKVLANPPGVPNPIFSQAHDMYVQVAAELGVVGLVALAVLLIAVGRRFAAARQRHGDRIRLEAIAVLGGLVAFAVESVFDNTMNLPAICMLLVGVVAWVEAGIPVADPDPAGRPPAWRWRIAQSRALPMLGLAGIALAIPTLLRIDIATAEDVAGNDAALAGDWPAALGHFAAANANDPDFTLYTIQLAGANAQLGRLSDARTLLSQAVVLDQVGINQVGLGALDLALGDIASAMDNARAAASLAPGSATVALNAGLIGEAAGDEQFALDEFADAIAANPALARVELWDAPERTVSKDQIIAAAQARSDPLESALILGYAGRADEAEALLKLQPDSDTRNTYLAAAAWLGGDAAQAKNDLVALLSADPLDWFSAAWMSRISHLTGDEEAAARYGAWAVTVEADSAPRVIGERSAIPPVLNASSAGLPQSYPTGVYVRTQARFLPMPQLTLIGPR
jgi:O-antigen ligase